MLDFYENNVLTLREIPDDQFSIFWVDFPEPIGRHPAIVLGHERWADTTDRLVAPITSTPPNDARYADLSVPISISFDRVSYIKMGSITTVNRKLFRGRIGYLPYAYRPVIMERFMAIMTGASVKRLVPKFNGTDYSNWQNEMRTTNESHATSGCDAVNPVKETLSAPLDTTVVPEQTVATTNAPTGVDDTPNNSDTPITMTLSDVKNMLKCDPEDAEYFRDILSVAKFTPKNMSVKDIIGTFVMMTRDYGYKTISADSTKFRRYTNLVNEMANRGIINRNSTDSVMFVVKTEFLMPSNKREWTIPG